jgi:hypothetical protein
VRPPVSNAIGGEPWSIGEFGCTPQIQIGPGLVKAYPNRIQILTVYFKLLTMAFGLFISVDNLGA